MTSIEILNASKIFLEILKELSKMQNLFLKLFNTCKDKLKSGT